MKQGRPTFLSLELGRAVAAALVCGFHGSAAVDNLVGRYPFHDIVRGGHMGVEYFFVLSGFVMSWSHRDDPGRAGAFRGFVEKRLIRIVPTYWIVLTIMIAVSLAAAKAGHARGIDPLTIARNYLLLVPTDKLYVGVAWTLQHELFFYLLFAIGILVPRLGLTIIWGWQALVLLVNLIVFDVALSDGPEIVFGILNVGFGLGMAIAHVSSRSTIGRPAAMALVGFGLAFTLAVFIGEWWIGGGTPHTQLPLGDKVGPLLYMAGCGLVILGSVQLELARETPRKAPSFAITVIVVAGASSYVFYLIHGLCLSVAIRVFRPLAMPELIFVLAVAAALAIGVLAHLLIEKPLLRGCRRLFARDLNDRPSFEALQESRPAA